MLSPSSAGMSGFYNSFNAINTHLLCQELKQHEHKSEEKKQEGDQYFLVPFGLAIHHIMQSHQLASLFDGLK